MFLQGRFKKIVALQCLQPPGTPMAKSFAKASYWGMTPLNFLFPVIPSANVLVAAAVGCWLA